MGARAYQMWKDNDETSSNILVFNPPKVNAEKRIRRKSEVYPFQIDDLKKMVDYYKSNEAWLQYMLLVVGCNTARRVGDLLSLTWEHMYNPQNGKFRVDILEFVEDKTDKLANPRINKEVRNAIELYIEKTGCDVSKNNYREPMFMQLSGTHKGTVITSDGYRKSLKKAANAVGITYNVGTHSPRKTFGMLSRMIHPHDYDSMELLQTIYNHSDTKTTKHYIGLTKQKIDQYYDDFGDLWGDYVTGDKEFKSVSTSPVVTLEVSDLRDIITMAYTEGLKNDSKDNVDKHLEAVNDIMEIVSGLIK